MDAYTNPPPNTYKLGAYFIHSGVPAVAVASSQFPFIAAIYTILIQLLFGGLWQLVSNVVIAFLRSTNRIQFVGLVAFWNANDPWTALIYMSAYLWQIALDRNRRGARWGNFRWGVVMYLPAAVLAIGSLVVGILYPGWLKLGEAAPVHPSAVFSPLIEDPGQSTIIKFNTLYLPSTLRALGSAEAFDYNSRRSSVRVTGISLPESNATHPQSRIDYSYHIQATDFGLQKPLDLVHNVTGSCYTEYGWIHPSSTLGEEGEMNEYWLWGDETASFLVPGPRYPGAAKLDFMAFPHPQTNYMGRNISFSLIAFTADVGSMTPSNDPWYLTQPLNRSLSSSDSEHGYQIKSGRPILSCWQETLFCLNGVCDNIGLMTDVPKGIQLILAATHTMPMIMNIALRAGVSSLKSYIGSAAGQVIDAASSTMLADIKRLVLAAFFSSREVFRDAALMDRPSGLANQLEDGEGKLYPGAGDFIIRTGDVVSIRFDLLLVAPVACILIWTVVGIFHALKSASTQTSGIFYMFRLLSSFLRGTQLYRMLDEAHGNHKWEGESGLIPFPCSERDEEVWTPKPVLCADGGPIIKFERAGSQTEGGSRVPNGIAAVPGGAETISNQQAGARPDAIERGGIELDEILMPNSRTE